jgi:hypothetical protein
MKHTLTKRSSKVSAMKSWGGSVVLSTIDGMKYAWSKSVIDVLQRGELIMASHTVLLLCLTAKPSACPDSKGVPHVW